MFRPGFIVLTMILACLGAEAQDSSSLGIFENQTDVGTVLHPGSMEYNAASKTYTVAGSGDDMWLAEDDFHFVWKKVSAEDLTLTANIAILGEGGNGHRKGVLMIRQGFDPDDPYVDAARHGDGLTSIQFRETKGATTREIESNVSAPATLRIEKRGNSFYLWIAGENEDLKFAGGSAWVLMRMPFYVGIGVCAHDKNSVEKAAFSNVELDLKPKRATGKGKYSSIETVLLSGDARSGYVSQKRIAAPGWSADGRSLTFEEDGHPGQTPFTPLRTAAPVREPIAGKPAAGFTYFESNLGGRTRVWRKSADGEQQPFTPDELNAAAPHVSPDGKYLLFLSYSNEYKKLSEDMPVELMLMSLTDSSLKTLANFVGGPDSLGAEPWSPDGQRAVFVSYQWHMGSR